MTKRVITGAFVTLLLLAGIFLPGCFMMTLLSAFMLIAAYEMLRALRSAGMQPVGWTVYAFCLMTIAAKSLVLARPEAPDLTMAALTVSAMLGMVHLVIRGKIAVNRMMATLFPMLYPGIFFAALMNLMLLNSRTAVVTALALAFFSASVNDVFALFAGLLLGKHKLSPALSPKKTIEGSIGGLIASVLFSMAVPSLLRLIFAKNAAFIAGYDALPPIWAFALLGLVGGALSQIGDLTASMVKRHCGVKDFGRLLPGHGGIMDRLDGVLFFSTACYVFFTLVGLG